MSLTLADATRMTQLNALYQTTFGDAVDLDKFIGDDLYALQTLKRALESNVPVLRNLAAHIEAQRAEAIESITIKPLEPPPDVTWKMDVIGDMYLRRRPLLATPERRTGNRLLSAGEILLVGRFKRLYHQEFGRRFDIEKFSRDDVYGREVLAEALASPNQPLIDLAKRFFDESGAPKYHRRNSSRGVLGHGM